MSDDRRRRELAKIHLVARKQLGMDEETYRAMLQEVTGVDSAGKLDQTGRTAVLNHLRRFSQRPSYPGRPGTIMDRRMLQKIEALLAEARRPWGYAHTMAKRMHKVDRVQWCDDDQLRSIIAALCADAKRHGRPT